MKAKLSVLSQKAKMLEIETKVGESSDIVWGFTVEAPPSEFSRASFDIKLNNKYPGWEQIDIDDRVTFSLSEDDEKFSIRFAGEVDELETLSNEDGSKELQLRVLSPFFRLQLVYLDQHVLSGCTGLREISRRVMEISRIWGELKIDDDIDDQVDIGYIYNYPAFSLFRSIFLQKDLVFDNDLGYFFRVSNRSTFIRESLADIKTVEAKSMRTKKTRR